MERKRPTTEKIGLLLSGVALLSVCYLVFESWRSKTLASSLNGEWSSDLGTNAIFQCVDISDWSLSCELTTVGAAPVTLDALLITVYSLFSGGWYGVAKQEDRLFTLLYSEKVLSLNMGDTRSTEFHRIGFPDIGRKKRYIIAVPITIISFKWLQKVLSGSSKAEEKAFKKVLIMQSASKREMCYDARDAHFKCLDKMPEDAEKECAATLQKFHSSCPKSWTSYFEKQREREVMLQLQQIYEKMSLGESLYVKRALSRNYVNLGQVRTFSALVGGIAAGLGGISGLMGIAFFFANALFTSFLIILVLSSFTGDRTKVQQYLPKGSKELFSFENLISGGMTYVLSWTLAYNFIYTF